jgi:hypothetical protein
MVARRPQGRTVDEVPPVSLFGIDTDQAQH